MTARGMDLTDLRRAMGLDLFERRTPDEPYGYKLVMPGVMIGAEELEFSYADGAYTATQTEDGRTWTGTASYHQAAILALIADRMGFTATIEPKPEPEDDEP